MALATRNGDRVAVRMVNVYTFEDCFYLVTETTSNKFRQIGEHDCVALSVDAVQITGRAVFLAHPGDETNREFVDFIEAQLPEQFARYAAESEKRLIKNIPETAGFISLKSGQGYAMNFAQNQAFPIHR